MSLWWINVVVLLCVVIQDIFLGVTGWTVVFAFFLVLTLGLIYLDRND